MNFWLAVLRQAGRNLRQTWPSQMMTLLTVGLSVLLFALFFLIYQNMLHAGDQLGDDLRLIVYLEEEPGPEMKEQLKRKITNFDEVEEIEFISRQQAYKNFSEQLGEDRDVLDDLPLDFLPASIEVTPKKNLRSLAQVQLFSEYLNKLPGTIKVQYGQEWVERFFYFTKLVSLVVVLSGSLLILTSIFKVAHTIRLTIINRQAELELLKLVGATNNYIRTPFLIEGLLQGLLGAFFGIFALYTIYSWIKLKFSGPGLLHLFDFAFFSGPTIFLIVVISIMLCTVGSYTSIQKYLRR